MPRHPGLAKQHDAFYLKSRQVGIIDSQLPDVIVHHSAPFIGRVKEHDSPHTAIVHLLSGNAMLSPITHLALVPNNSILNATAIYRKVTHGRAHIHQLFQT